jgi:hypothetical protein
MLGHFLARVQEVALLFGWVLSRLDNTQQGPGPAYYAERPGIPAATIPASLRLLSLPLLHATSPGTTGSARILRISP